MDPIEQSVDPETQGTITQLLLEVPPVATAGLAAASASRQLSLDGMLRVRLQRARSTSILT